MPTEPTDTSVAEHSPTLVLSGPLASHRQTVCSDLLGVEDCPAMLVLAYHRRPRVVAEELADHDVTALTVLSLGEQPEPPETPAFDGDLTLDNCAAANLTRVGIAVTEALERHAESDLHVCLDSLTTLLQYVSLETAFKFLQVTLSRLDAADAVVHAHLDPDAVDEQTATTLLTLFDSVLERRDETWAFQSP